MQYILKLLFFISTASLRSTISTELKNALCIFFVHIDIRCLKMVVTTILWNGESFLNHNFNLTCYLLFIEIFREYMIKKVTYCFFVVTEYHNFSSLEAALHLH